jgi:hypothetical protein
VRFLACVGWSCCGLAAKYPPRPVCVKVNLLVGEMEQLQFFTEFPLFSLWVSDGEICENEDMGTFLRCILKAGDAVGVVLLADEYDPGEHFFAFAALQAGVLFDFSDEIVANVHQLLLGAAVPRTRIEHLNLIPILLLHNN